MLWELIILKNKNDFLKIDINSPYCSVFTGYINRIFYDCSIAYKKENNNWQKFPKCYDYKNNGKATKCIEKKRG